MGFIYKAGARWSQAVGLKPKSFSEGVASLLAQANGPEVRPIGLWPKSCLEGVDSLLGSSHRPECVHGARFQSHFQGGEMSEASLLWNACMWDEVMESLLLKIRAVLTIIPHLQ